MRLLMTTDTVGGVWTYALELARALMPHGVEVALATMGGPISSSQQEEIRRLPHVLVYASEYKLEWMEEPWADVAEAGEWLLWIERCVRPDVVHLNGYAHGALPWRAPSLVVGHSCVLSWWEGVYGGDAGPEWDRYRQEVARGLRAAGRVLAPTAWMLATRERFYGPLPPSQVIPNGRDPARFLPGEKEPFVFSAGRLWDGAKNLGVVDVVAKRLAWPIYVAGEQQHPDGGGRIGSDGVRPLGHLPPHTVADWLARASIYVLPAKYEPFGLSILEAALAGCALVVGDIPTLRELWNGAAIFVPPGDIDGLEAALSDLIADPARRSTLGARARARALQFTPDRMATDYLSLYRELKAPDVRHQTPVDHAHFASRGSAVPSLVSGALRLASGDIP
jgi:glycogen(starch) synthase